MGYKEKGPEEKPYMNKDGRDSRHRSGSDLKNNVQDIVGKTYTELRRLAQEAGVDISQLMKIYNTEIARLFSVDAERDREMSLRKKGICLNKKDGKESLYAERPREEAL